MFLIYFFRILFPLYRLCTATVTLIILFIMYLLPEKIKLHIINQKYIIIALILSAIIVIWLEAILKIDFVNRIVVDYFQKSYTITGRLEIYSKYLRNVISGSFWVGYGYSNELIEKSYRHICKCSKWST